MSVSKLLLGLGALALATTAASAQTPIYGVDVRLARFIRTDTGNFVGNLVNVGPNANPVFALDFDNTATTLWGINNTTLQYGNFTLATGVFNPVGVLGAGPVGNMAGLTCDANGQWYLLVNNATTLNPELWKGDVTTGTFALVSANIAAAQLMIDISIDSQGNLYGMSITNDSLYSISTVTGVGTLLGPHGQAANFAQGMDFDWSTDTLYGAIYTGGGTGVFCQYNLANGSITVLQATTPTNGEYEIACEFGVCSSFPVTYCTAKVNSQGCQPAIGSFGSMSATATSGFILSASQELNNKVGLVLYSEFGRDASPFGPGGILCVKAPTRRSKGFNSGGTPPPAADCSGVFSIDFNTFARGLLGAPPTPAAYLSIPGQVVTAQFWGRDPGIAAPNNFSLSNGIEFTVCP